MASVPASVIAVAAATGAPGGGPSARWRGAAVLALALGLAGCDQLGIESATATAARKEADGKAIGAGCRHAARSVEQCYQLNKRADKAAVFAGWKEMNDYMRENQIEAVPPPPDANAATVADAAGVAGADGADRDGGAHATDAAAPRSRKGEPARAARH